MPPAPDAAEEDRARSPWAIFLIFLRLGLTSFGGPVAHLGYFHAEFVERRRWLDAPAYADLVALCQFLPGPASSQVGMALGLRHQGRSARVINFCSDGELDEGSTWEAAMGASHHGVRQVWSRSAISPASPGGNRRERDSVATSSPVRGRE